MSVESFLTAYAKETQIHPFTPKLRVWELSVVFEVSFGANYIVLDFIQALFKGRGLGRRGLEWFLKLADEHQVQVIGYVKRCGTEGLTQGQLRAWYKRHGFVIPPNSQEMTYKPRKKEKAA